jgi:hypothetical protein
VKTTFDLPDRLLRRAKAVAARQGRPLRELVAEAIEARITHDASEIAEPTSTAAEERQLAWERWRSRLVESAEGVLENLEAADDAFFDSLEAIRREPWSERDPLTGR